MRLWSIHPSYLDSRGLVALWREALLAQKVLMGNIKGYKNHPQLIRFKEHPCPVQAIASYLSEVAKEAQKRGYRFDIKKIGQKQGTVLLSVSSKQIEYERKHLLKKLSQRDIFLYEKIKIIRHLRAHPIFIIKQGPLEAWERVSVFGS